MAATLTFQPQLKGSLSYNNGLANAAAQATLTLGNQFAAVVPGSFPQFTYGNAPTYVNNALQINDCYINRLTIAAGATTSINLNTGSDKNPFGISLAWAFLKVVVLSLVTPPDGAINIRVGPQGVANSAQLWYGGIGATVYEGMYSTMIKTGPAAGWTITASTANLFNIKNPGAGSIIVDVLLGGGS